MLTYLHSAVDHDIPEGDSDLPEQEDFLEDERETNHIRRRDGARYSLPRKQQRRHTD